MEQKLSCIDCGVINCLNEDKAFPEFCPGEACPPEVLKEAMNEYEKDDIRTLTIAAAETEAENYCKMTRLEETMEFAKKIGAKKLGIATCAGLLSESRIAARIFRKNGFEVFGISCKCATQKKVDVGIPSVCNSTGENMCNPILQAKYLNHEKTDLNVLIGLCVGHDSLFYKYSEAPVTTLVSKDRVLAHNTVAALYQADKYLKLL
ncbi:MAG: DUF1847 domain-containing protein [Eubacterium sp.]|nr:DUF1847 domain-containing protein [Eubacterium sp.]